MEIILLWVSLTSGGSYPTSSRLPFGRSLSSRGVRHAPHCRWPTSPELSNRSSERVERVERKKLYSLDGASGCRQRSRVSFHVEKLVVVFKQIVDSLSLSPLYGLEMESARCGVCWAGTDPVCNG